MQKKLIALALASAFAAPAFAATSNVDIGGTMAFSVDYLDSDNITGAKSNGGTVGVSSNASNIYFKGNEDLGGGLKAIWQIQTYFSAGGTGNADTAFGGSDGVGSGNTFVGLSGGFGTVILGKNESPVKMLSRKVDFFNNQIGDSRNLTADVVNSGTATTVTAAGVGFDTRPNNLIAYVTPDFSGFSATLGYFSNYDSGAAIDHSVDGYAVAGSYENGPLMLGLGYEQHNISNANVAGLTGDENVWRLVGSYAIGNFKFAGLYQWGNDLGGVSSADQDVWGLGGAYAMGSFTFKAQYYNASELHSVANTGADMWDLGVDYTLSKRTKLQFAYAETNNDSAAKFSAFGGGHGDNPGTGLGGNPSGFSMGVVHSF